MGFPAYGTAPIRCGKRKCDWRGYETGLSSVPHKTIKSATQSACPACGCTNYSFMTEREIAAWEHATTAAHAATSTPQALTRCAAARDGDCTHAQCPQLRDGEPANTGRHCPLDNHTED